MRPDERLDLRMVGKRQVTGSHDQPIGLTQTIFWNKPLEIPGGIGGTSSCGRLGKPDTVSCAEHENQGQLLPNTVIPGLGVDVARTMIDEFQGKRGIDIEIGQWPVWRVGTLDAVSRRNGAQAPWAGRRFGGRFACKDDGAIFRSVDVTGPEQPDKSALENIGAGNALKRVFDGTVCQ